MNVNELPQYKCHKVVRAGKILATARNPNEDAVFLDVDGVVNKWLFAPTGWLNKHNPDIGGYLVAYEDGYLSYSPAAAFEAGYRPVELEEPLTGDGSASTSTGPVVGDVPYLYPCKGGEGLAFVEGALPHQVRVIEEYNQLYKRHIDLTKFFDTDLYRSLSVEERNRLKEQSLFMAEYQRVLLERIRAF